MSWELDPEVAGALAPLFAQMAGATPTAPGDYETRREVLPAMMEMVMAGLPDADEIAVSSHIATAPDGVAVPLSLYAPAGGGSGALVVYAHGGGMIMGSVEAYDRLLRYLVARAEVPLLAVDYRLAPEHPHPTPVEDCYAGLIWAAEHATELGVDPARIAIAGDSAGGGLAAATALLARDRGTPSLARQILLYPMLDDRNLTAPAAVPEVLLWSYDDNVTGWGALLGDRAGGSEVPAYAAPARAEDLSGLPPTFISVGDLDIFCQEDMHYAARLSRAGVPVELHIHAGAPHGFDLLGFGSGVSARAFADEVRVMQSI